MQAIISQKEIMKAFLSETFWFANESNNKKVHTTNTASSSYDVCSRPFKPDANRGRWSRPIDFVFACTNNTFCSGVFSELPVHAFCLGGVYFLPAYLCGLILISLTVFIIQAFLGQFSSSGSISAFRVCPIFKGIGYSILVLNLVSLTYYSIIAAVPLFYAVSSLRRSIPWMHCNNSWNSVNCSSHSEFDEDELELDPHATVEFFHSLIRSAGKENADDDDRSASSISMSWPLFGCTIVIWMLVTLIIIQRIQFIGKFFRFTLVTIAIAFVAVCCCIFSQVDVTMEEIKSFLVPQLGFSHKETINVAIQGAASMQTLFLGPGWGSVLTLASYNTFRRDSQKFTFWVTINHVVVFVAAIFCGRVAWDHFENHVGFFIYHYDEEHHLQFVYLCFAYLLGSLPSWPNFWSFLFFFMLFMAEFSAVIVQMLSVLTALFDEYEELRTKKKTIKLGLIGFLFITSTFFCTKTGFHYVNVMPLMTILTHFIISMIFVMMATWAYGRLRFQRDLQFMLGKTISKFKITMIRFVTPAFLILSVITFGFIVETHGNVSSGLVIATLLTILSLCPIYMIYKMCQTTGSIRSRLKQCFDPQDWHPVTCDNRRYYEELMGNREMLVISEDT